MRLALRDIQLGQTTIRIRCVGKRLRGTPPQSVVFSAYIRGAPISVEEVVSADKHAQSKYRFS